MYFSKQFIKSLKQSISLEHLIGQFIELKPQGENLVGLCPFHQEHQPSFTVFPQTQSFYCFGCGAGSKSVTQSSDHLSFLMAFEKRTFQQAVIRLAQITNTPLPIQKSTSTPTVPQIASNTGGELPQEQASANTTASVQPLTQDPVSQEILNRAAEFYHQQLFKPEAKKAFEYLTEQRQRSLESIYQFKIGFAQGYQTLYRFLKQQGFTDKQLLDSGLVAKRGLKIWDYFFGNIIVFPHFKDGQVIGFTIKDFGQYKNEVKRRLFKRDTLYNQDWLQDISDRVILVEGESDLHSICQFTDYTNVVALCGNCLTPAQLNQLLEAKITTVYLALDRDAAGQKATLKITHQLTELGISVAPLKWHDHKDIDLWLRFTPPEERRQAFAQLIAAAEPNTRHTPHATAKTTTESIEPIEAPKAAKSQNQAPRLWNIIKERLKIIVVLLMVIYFQLRHIKTPLQKQPTAASNRKNQYHYRPRFTLDTLPVIQKNEPVPHYSQLLNQYQQQHGHALKPVKRRANKRKPSPEAICQYCHAPVEYLSLNDGQHQVYCKVCQRFSNPSKQIKETVLFCPHCSKQLEKMKKDTEKNGYEYYKCRNTNCPFFLNQLKRKKQIKNPQKQKAFKKLHYIYRKPLFDITQLHPDSPSRPKVDLANVRVSADVIGLICTYQLFGLSCRNIATLMKEIHQVEISHQSVKNYLNAVAYRLAPLVLNFPYELSGTLAADETYLRLVAKWGYLTWALDPKKQIIAAFNISEKRNLKELARAIHHAISKFPAQMLTENADFNPLVVTDGNPVYQLIMQFLKQANIHVQHKVVIGLDNHDDESTNFRNLKQIIERLNKNFKKYINHSEYFGSMRGANSAAILFVAHFNFVRQNTRLGGNVPVPIESVVKQQTQPLKWVRLIEYAQNYAQMK